MGKDNNGHSRATRISHDEFLEYVPSMNPAVRRVADRRLGPLLEWDVSSAGRGTGARRFFPAWFFRLRRPHRLALDDFGRRAIDAVDGTRSLADVARELAPGSGHSEEAMREAVIAFFGELARRNVVALAPRGK